MKRVKPMMAHITMRKKKIVSDINKNYIMKEILVKPKEDGT